MSFKWLNADKIPSRSYQCGYCGRLVASASGWKGEGDRNVHQRQPDKYKEYLFICPHCMGPTYVDHDENQIPGFPFGEPVEHISNESVEALYAEARRCTKVGAYTASVLCCRKLLMNIAVAKGAPEGQRFVEYATYLSDQGYVPKDAKEWVDHIRKKGNEATHEIAIMSKEDAHDLISFSEMLLRLIYEFPGKMKGKAPPDEGE